MRFRVEGHREQRTCARINDVSGGRVAWKKTAFNQHLAAAHRRRKYRDRRVVVRLRIVCRHREYNASRKGMWVCKRPLTIGGVDWAHFYRVTAFAGNADNTA